MVARNRAWEPVGALFGLNHIAACIQPLYRQQGSMLYREPGMLLRPESPSSCRGWVQAVHEEGTADGGEAGPDLGCAALLAFA